MTSRTEGAAALPTLPSPARLAVGDVLRLGLTGVRGRPLRAALSALGIAVGVATVVAIFGITTGSQAHINDRLAAVGTNLLTVSAGRDLYGRPAELPAEALSMVRRIARVRSASAASKLPDVHVYRTDRIDRRATGGIAVQAVRLDLPAVVGAEVAVGDWLNEATARVPAVVLGATAARQLGIERPGLSVHLGGERFTVVGILRPTALAPELDRSVMVGWDTARDRLGFDGHPGTVYERSADETVEEVRAVLASTANPTRPSETTVSRPSDALALKRTVDSTLTTLLIGLGSVSLLVGGIGVANTMAISVLERRVEIGVRRALGATRGQIRLQFLTEAAALAALGALAGTVVGLAGSSLWALQQSWPVTVPTRAVLGGLLTAGAVGVLAGLYPSAKAARTPPAEALASV